MKKLFTLLLLFGIVIALSVFATNAASTDHEAGSSQSLSILDNASLSITGDLTISLWIKKESQPGVGASYMLVWKGVALGTERSYGLWYRAPDVCVDTDKSCFFLTVSSNCTVGSQDNLEIARHLDNGVWYHVAAVWTAASSQVRFYINGLSIGTVTGAQTSIADCASRFEIGGASGGSTFDGKIDEVKIYNRVLSADEIRKSYRRELVGNEPNLQGYWKLDYNFLDRSSNANNLTNNNATPFSADWGFRNVQLIEE